MAPNRPKMTPADPASTFEDSALARLRESGLRVTMARIQVIRTLASAARPLSPYAIHEAITSGGGRIDVVSVYRILSSLAELDLVHHISAVDGYLACELHGHHDREIEHLICRECGSVQELDLPGCAKSDLTEQLTQAGFAADSIKVEVLGLCPACQPSA